MDETEQELIDKKELTPKRAAKLKQMRGVKVVDLSISILTASGKVTKFTSKDPP